MAIRVQKITLGIDVGKDWLDVQIWEGAQTRIGNEPEAIAKFLNSLPAPAQIAIEPTSTYHLEFIARAHRLGHEVFLINPRQLAHYRVAVGERNKTDPTDAWLLARFLAHERAQLRRFDPPCQKAQQLWSLIKRRALIVTTRQRLRQSLRAIRLCISAVERELKRLLVQIDARILKLIGQLGWSAQYHRCKSIPGIGPLNAAALVCAFHRGTFDSVAAFIAYLGLDVRIRQSGTFKGKCKLTKHGEPELRRLLFCAAKPARSYPPFAQYHQRQLDKGLSKIAANVILARKLARIAFALLKNQQTFNKQTQEA